MSADTNDPSHLEELQKIYQGNVQHLEKQIARHGGYDLAPLAAKNEYDSNLAMLKTIQAQLGFSFTGRMDRFLGSIVAGIQELQAQGVEIEVDSLASDERIVTVLAHASQIAIKNHQKQKISSLRNCVLNSVLSTTFNEELELVFLNIIDQLTPWQLIILEFINRPRWDNKQHIWQIHYDAIRSSLGDLSHEITNYDDFDVYIKYLRRRISSDVAYGEYEDKNFDRVNEEIRYSQVKRNLKEFNLLYPKESWITLSEALVHSFPDFQGKDGFCRLTTRVLQALGLTVPVYIDSREPPPFIMLSKTTPMGKQFLEYIAAPRKNTDG